MKLPHQHTVEEVAERYRRHPRTIRDWINVGCPTPNGRVKLPAAKYGKSWNISEEALVLFEHRVRPDDGRPDLDLE